MRGVEHVPWFYDAFMGLVERFGLARWRRWLTAGASGRTLEVGCGTGRNLPLYQVSRPIACEPDLRVLLAARGRAAGALLLAADVQRLPFPAASFDTVVASLVFCSVDEPEVGLAEVRRVLAEGGSLRMLEHVRATSRLAGRLQDLAQPAWTWIAGGCRPNRRTERTVERAGFRIEDATRRANRQMRRFVALPDDRVAAEDGRPRGRGGATP